jgi:hypothetical protein
MVTEEVAAVPLDIHVEPVVLVHVRVIQPGGEHPQAAKLAPVLVGDDVVGIVGSHPLGREAALGLAGTSSLALARRLPSAAAEATRGYMTVPNIGPPRGYARCRGPRGRGYDSVHAFPSRALGTCSFFDRARQARGPSRTFASVLRRSSSICREGTGSYPMNRQELAPRRHVPRLRLRAGPLAIGFVLLAALSSVRPREALAQSDADKALARSLGEQASDALDRKDYARALELFGRAEKLYQAPTLTLGVARSLAGVGKLVAASEVYSKLAGESLPKDSPAAFVAAIEAAKVEGAQVQARLGTVVLRIEGPADATAAKITVNGEPVPVTALGAKRLVDPGEIVARATLDGHVPAEEKVTVGEGKTAEVRLRLVRIEPAPAVAVPPPQEVRTEEGSEKPGRATAAGPNLGLLVGLRVGYLLTGGKTGATSSGASQDTSRLYGGGPGGEIDLGVRFKRHFAAYAWYEKQFLGGGGGYEDTGGTSHQVTAGRDAVGLGVQIASRQNPAGGIGVFGELGVLLLNRYAVEDKATSGLGTCTTTNALSGNSIRVGGGAHVPVAGRLLISPFATGEVGRFVRLSRDSSGAGCPPGAGGDYALDERDVHLAALMGVSVAWAHDFDPR